MHSSAHCSLRQRESTPLCEARMPLPHLPPGLAATIAGASPAPPRGQNLCNGSRLIDSLNRPPTSRMIGPVETTQVSRLGAQRSHWYPMLPGGGASSLWRKSSHEAGVGHLDPLRYSLDGVECVQTPLLRNCNIDVRQRRGPRCIANQYVSQPCVAGHFGRFVSSRTCLSDQCISIGISNRAAKLSTSAIRCVTPVCDRLTRCCFILGLLCHPACLCNLLAKSCFIGPIATQYGTNCRLTNGTRMQQP